MKNSLISLLMKISIALVAIGGLCICAFWYPFSFSLSSTGVQAGELAQNTAFLVQLIFYWIVSIPCFAILVFVWIISNSIKKENVFTSQTVKLLNTSFITLFISSCVFLIGTTVFTILEWSPFAIVYYFVGIIGIILSFGTYVISKFIEKAKQLKEENESIL